MKRVKGFGNSVVGVNDVVDDFVGGVLRWWLCDVSGVKLFCSMICGGSSGVTVVCVFST